MTGLPVPGIRYHKPFCANSPSEARTATSRVPPMLSPRSHRVSIAAAVCFGLVFVIAPSARAQGGYPTKAAPQAIYAAPQTTYAAPQATATVPPLAPSAPLAASLPLATHAAPQPTFASAQGTYAAYPVTAAPQAYASGQLASPQCQQPCACYYPQGFCPFPQGNCAFPRGNCVAPCGNCIETRPSSQWPAASGQLGSTQLSRSFAQKMIGD
jgi:hypothetical protein